MYKMLLVDDEATMRTRMLAKIQWQEYDFEIVADGENGIDALEKFELHKPDVVITDIKMPFMDGLELSTKILEKYPLTKIIILTGFDDFEYAKAAINLNVIDYILKPITHDNIIKVLSKTKDLLDKEYQEKRDINRLKEYYDSSFPIMRNRVLHQFVSGRMPKEIIDNRLSYYHINLPDGPYRVGMISPNKSAEKLETDVYETHKLILAEIVENIVKTKGLGLSYIYEDTIVIIFCFDGEKDENNKKLESVIYETSQYAEKYMAFSIKISVGHKYQQREEISISYKEAKSALDYASNSDKNEIIYIGDREPENKSKFIDIKEVETIRAIKTCAIDTIDNIIDTIFNEIEHFNIPEKDYKIFLLEYMLKIIKTANLQNVAIDESEYSQDKLILLLKKANSLAELKAWIHGLAKYVIDEILKLRNNTNSNHTRKAKIYVQDNYQDSETNIEKLCNTLYLTPNYFCALFKKETGMTFNNYLTIIRLDRAKELLQSTDKKNFEIAELTGFSDANYFSYCFKKNIGISPSQYRKMQV